MSPYSVPTSLQASSGGIWQQGMVTGHPEKVWKLRCKGNPALLSFAACPLGTSGFYFPGSGDMAQKQEEV